MNRTILASTAFVALSLVGFAAFQSPTPPQDPPKPAATPAPTPAPQKPGDVQRLRDPKAALRFSGIPDADKEKSAKQFEPVCKWLSKELGRPVEFVPVTDYETALVGFGEKKIDMIWVNSVSAVRAEALCGGHCQPIFAREDDLQRRSYFIANKKLVDSGKFKVVEARNPMTLDLLAAMKPNLAGLSFGFGSRLSVASHLMPRFFLEKPEVGIDPEQAFKPKPGYAEGGDAGVQSSVAAGSLDLGVVSAGSWESAKDEQKAQAPVIFVTPVYTDCCMVWNTAVSSAVLPLIVTTRFVHLSDPTAADQKPVFEAFGTKKFIGVGVGSIEPIRATLKSATERKLLE